MPTAPGPENSTRSSLHIFVPRWMDRDDRNAQNSNAKALLSRFSDPEVRWTAIAGETPVPSVVKNGIEVRKLSRSHLWPYELLLSYQKRFDAIFYPGVMWPDEFGLKARRSSGRRIPVIATMEGIIADAANVARLARHFGHPIFSQPGVEQAIPRLRWMYSNSDHIIAISPFLARVAEFLYGKKVSYLPLGIDTGMFHSAGRQEPARCRVVTAGTVKNSKNPELFVELARRYRDAEFVWFGDGQSRSSLIRKATSMGLTNLTFAGSLPPEELADEFRKSSIFVLTSHSEGVPKVTQEAAACGLPVVLNGYFEAPSVLHERNGLVAWSDEELTGQVGRLIQDPQMRAGMGQKGAEMAKEWDWNRIAPQWEQVIVNFVKSACGAV